MAFNMLIRRMQIKDYHCHGFRSSFKDWSVEKTDVPDLVSEMALAHDVGSGTVKAYRRSDPFEKRRALTQAWVDFCYTETEGPRQPIVRQGAIIAGPAE